MLDCLCFRGLINRDVKESDSLEVEPVVPVNLLLFPGASIGSVADAGFGGGMPANVMRGIGDSDLSVRRQEDHGLVRSVRYPTDEQTFDCGGT